MAGTRTLSLLITGNSSSAQAALDKTGLSAKAAGEANANAGKVIGGAMIAASAAVVAFGVSAVKSTDEYGKNVLKIQRLTGLTSEEASKLAYSARIAGVDIDTLGTGITRLDKNMTDTPAKFDKLGIATRDAGGHLRSTTDVLKDVADKVVALGPGAASTALEVDLLGRGGAALGPLLSKGSAGIQELSDEASKMGLVLSQNNVNDIAANLKSQRELGAAFDGLKTKVGLEIIPILTTLENAFLAIPAPVTDIAVPLAGFGVVALTAVAGISKLASVASSVLGPALGAVRSAMSGMPAMFEGLAAKAGMSGQTMDALGAALVPGLVGAVAVVGAAFIGFEVIQKINADRAKEQKAKADAYTQAIESQTGTLQGNITAAIAADFAHGNIGKTLAGTTANMELFGHAITSSRDELDAFANQAKTGRLENFESDLRKSAESGSALGTELLRLKTSGELSTTQIMELTKSLDSSAIAFDDGTSQAALNKGMQQQVAGAYTATNETIEQQVQDLKDQADRMKAATDPYFAATKAQSDLNDATQAYILTSLDSTRSQGDVDAAFLKMTQSGLSYEDTLLALAEGQLNGSASGDRMKAALDTLKQFGIDPTSEAGQRLIEKLTGIGNTASAVARPYNMSLTADTSQAEAALANLRNSLHNTQVAAAVSLAPSVPTHRNLDGTWGYAAGGSVQDGWFTVGEQGPELGYKSGANTQIFSNSQSHAMASSGGSGSSVNVTINMPPGANGDDVVNAIRRYEQRNGKAWRN